jgi:hypothetical protein
MPLVRDYDQQYIPRRPREMSELRRINEERDRKIKELQENCPHKETETILVKWDEDGHWDMSDGVRCSYCGKILKHLPREDNENE